MRDKSFNIAKNPCDGYHRGFPSMVYKFYDEKTFGNRIKNKNISGQQLAEELHKPVIRKLKKRKVQ